jgi:hypothetical protein
MTDSQLVVLLTSIANRIRAAAVQVGRAAESGEREKERDYAGPVPLNFSNGMWIASTAEELAALKDRGNWIETDGRYIAEIIVMDLAAEIDEMIEALKQR